MHTATPQEWLKGSRTIALGDDTEITFLPGGGHMAVTRAEREDGSLRLVVESFDRFGNSEGKQCATIRGTRRAIA